MTIEEIREAIGVLPRRKNGKIAGVPQALRREILSLARKEKSEDVARAVGISPTTLHQWKWPLGRKVREKKRFREILFSQKEEESVLTVEGPAGLRISGTVSDIALLLQKVSQ